MDTQNTFLNAAKQGKAVFIPVHVETALMKCGFMKKKWIQNAKVQRAGELSLELSIALKDKIPALITTQTSKPLIKQGRYDQSVKDRHQSAINNPSHSQFLDQNKTSIALISGTSVGLCIDWTLAACLERNIRPIVILDATNANVNATRMNEENAWKFNAIANKQGWLPQCLTASTHDIIKWAKELN